MAIEKDQLDEIVVLRFIAIISIVVWHCFACPYIYWGLAQHTPVAPYFKLIFPNLIPDANMPLFTFISGYLFCYLFQKGKYSDFKKFVINKAKRLLIPFFVIGTLVNLTAPQRYLSDILWGGGSHLWYVLMLFWCFMLNWILEKINNKYLRYIPFFVSFFLVSLRGSAGRIDHHLPLGMDHAAYYFCYFYFGFFIYKNIDLAYRISKRYLWLISIAFFVCVSTRILQMSYLDKLATPIITFSYCLGLWTAVNWLLELGKIHLTDWIKKVSTYSFGIYVFHEWIAWDTAHIPFIIKTMNEHYILFPFVYTTIIFFISYYLTKYLLKNAVGKFLLA